MVLACYQALSVQGHQGRYPTTSLWSTDPCRCCKVSYSSSYYDIGACKHCCHDSLKLHVAAQAFVDSRMDLLTKRPATQLTIGFQAQPVNLNPTLATTFRNSMVPRRRLWTGAWTC